MANVEFHDNTLAVTDAIKAAAIAFLKEAAGELQSQTQRNTRVDTGQTKGAWDYEVNESKLEAIVGNPLENAIWEEMGTGEYALNGNGRKGGWRYVDAKGKGHFTYGKRPSRAFNNAKITCEPKIAKAAQEKFKEMKA